MRIHFLIDWPPLSAADARDLSVARYPAGAVADVSDEAGAGAVAAFAGEATTADVTYTWTAPVAEPAPASEPAAVPTEPAPLVSPAPPAGA